MFWKDWFTIDPIDNTDGIKDNGIQIPSSMKDRTYDIFGRSVKHPSKGIYIQNGKKISIK